MKRKLLLGVAAGIVLLLGVLLTVFYVTVYRPTQAVFADLDRMAELKTLNAEIRGTGPYEPRPDGVLTVEQMAHFVGVQQAMIAGLGTDYGTLETRAAAIKGITGDGEGRGGLRIREAILVLKDLGPVLQRAKRAQVDALNRENLSLAEYRWIREAVYRALGFSGEDRYFEDYAATSTPESGPAEESTGPGDPIPEENRMLIAPYSRDAERWFPFLVFGL
jgi:hypothetical protein